VVQDLNSTNGTFINGRRVTTPAPLTSGDVIFLAKSVALVFHQQSAGEGASLAEEITVAPQSYEAMTAGFSSRQTAELSPYPRAAAVQSQEPIAEPPLEEKPERDWRRAVLACGCIVMLLVIACAASMFILDAFFPDVLYCDILRAPLEAVGYALNCP
jgi:hypothetical protein